MTGLQRRLSALEEIAEAARLRPYRLLAAELGCPFEELLADVEAARARYVRLQSAGLTDQEIFEQVAAERGVPVAQLEAECQRIEERYF